MARSIYKGETYEQVYRLDNYKVTYNDENISSNLCVVYCSSSNLYFPNTEEAFREAFIDSTDTFEWKNHCITRAYKNIWIRDITKEFYVRGINDKINSIAKLIDFIRKETEGMRVIMLGSSAGGYIATLLGCVLKAEGVFCFSGFFDLNILDGETWPLIKEPEYILVNYQWYNLCKLIENSEVDILYFYPDKLDGDKKQAEIVKEIKNVHSYRFRSSTHGIPFDDKILDKLLCKDVKYIIQKLHKFEKKRIYSLEWKLIWCGE